MFQKFYTDTLGGRFIKSLLAQTPIPIFESVVVNDHVIEGCYYIYKNRLILCTTTGVMSDVELATLFPGETLYPSDDLFPALSLGTARFKVIDYADNVTRKTHHKFESSVNYYDPETHYYLGKYLRYLYTNTGLNLFPYYNCYNGTYFSDVQISIDGVQRVTDQKYKLVAIPILLGHTYTIAIDCPAKVYMRAIMHDSTAFIEESSLSSTTQNVLASSFTQYTSLSFKQPVTFRVDSFDKGTYLLQKNLYLAIQLPKDNDSSIVVLENYDLNAAGDKTIKTDPNTTVRQYVVSVNPSLLFMNTRASYAFSDRLIEYLLGHVISHNDDISGNVAMVQRYLATSSSSYKAGLTNRIYTYGLWDSSIDNLINKLLVETDNELFDQDGNINKDVMRILSALR